MTSPISGSEGQISHAQNTPIVAAFYPHFNFLQQLPHPGKSHKSMSVKKKIQHLIYGWVPSCSIPLFQPIYLLHSPGEVEPVAPESWWFFTHMALAALVANSGNKARASRGRVTFLPLGSWGWPQGKHGKLGNSAIVDICRYRTLAWFKNWSWMIIRSEHGWKMMKVDRGYAQLINDQPRPQLRPGNGYEPHPTLKGPGHFDI